jgi:MFS family permease
VPIALIAVWLCLGKYTPAPLRDQNKPQDSHRLARPSMAILLLVGVTLSAMLMEGAGMDWSAIYMSKLFEAGPFLAGGAVATIALSQGLCRYFADGFVESQSPVLVARILLTLLTVGLILLLLATSPMLSLLGFALLGAGTSAIFPLAMSAAAQRTDRPASINVAALAQISFVAFLFGPPLLGFVAQHWGIEWAYGVGLPFVALSFWTSGALAPDQK